MNSQERQYFEKLSKQRLDLANNLDVPAARGVKESIINKYADQAHFLYELLQNADDAEATNVRFILKENQLIFAHNGIRHFSISDPDTEEEDTENGNLGDINAITSIGNSTKTEGNTIGKFGIGFKAVFSYTETPRIYDPKFRFKIERLIVPVLLNEDHPMRRDKETLFVFPFDHPEKPKEEAYEDISNKLQNLSFPLLFLSHLKRIDFKFQDVIGYYDKEINFNERQFDETIAEQICLTQNNGDESRDENLWLFSRKDESKRKYSVGYFLDDEGELRPIYNKPAFCFFQTKENTGLNFIIHAPFLLTDSRESILTGKSHNDTMLQNLANLSADALVYLRDIGQEKNIRLIDDDIYKIIPTDETKFSASSNKNQVSFLPFFNAIKEKFKTDRLLPASDGYVSKENAYWASLKNIPEIFSNEQLADIVENKDAKWVFISLSRENTDTELRKYIDDLIKTHIDANHIINGKQYSSVLIKGISKEFIEKQFRDEPSLAWFHKFYAWLSKRSRTSDLKYKPFFLDQNGNAVAAFNSSNNPNLYLPNDDMSEYRVIHPELLKNDDTYKFITTDIGLQKPSRIDYIREKIYPIYKNNNDGIDTDPHFMHFFKYYCECPEDRYSLFNLIKDLKFLKYDTCKNGEVKRYHGEASSMYMPTEALKAFFETKKDTQFIALDEYKTLVGADHENKLMMFLSELGVKNVLQIIDQPCCDQVNIEMCKEIINYIVKNKDVTTSVIVWTNLITLCRKENLHTRLIKYRWARKYRYPTDTPSNDAVVLKTRPWLVNSEGEFVSAQEVTKNTLSKEYDTSSIASQSLLSFLEIKEDNTSDLTDRQKEDLELGELCRALGITKDRLKKMQEKRKYENEQQKEGHEYKRYQANMKASRIEDKYDAWYDSDDDVPVSEQTPSEPPTDDDHDTDIDHDEYTPVSIDYNKRIERAKQRVGYTIKKLSVLENLQAEATNATKYSYGWFKALLELECLSHDETNANSKAVSITFAKVEREPGTERILVLKHPNRYIPMFMEDLADIPLVLHMEDQTKTIAIEVANIKSYTLRVKLKNNADIEGIDLCSVTSATIDAKSPAFLLQELRKGFHELGFEDHYNMKDNLCKNIEFVFGPPGTGKTTHLAQKVLIPMMQNNANYKVLVLTPTNKSADVLVRRIMEVSQDESYNNWLVRFGATGDEAIEQSPVFRDKTFDIRTLSKNITVTTIARFPYDFFMPQGERIFIHAIHWDYIVIDEASMIPIANIVFPLYKQKTPRKFIIAGDPFQIEPITSVNLWKDENIYTMVKLNSFTNPKTEPHPYKVELLTTQYRSIPDIGDIFSKFAYGGILTHHRSAQSQRPLNLGDGLDIKTLNIIKFPVSKYESIYRSKYLSHSSSYQIYSALFTFEYVCYLSKAIASSHPGSLFKIGVIAPYRAQADMIDKLLASENLPKEVDVQVGTIHGFQGDECDIIFAVFNTPPTISESPEMFLNKQNIINVSISRARDYLFLVMPDDQTENITNLRLVKHVEQLMHNTQTCHEQLSPNLEELMFGDPRYLENNAFSTSHQSVNVYGLPEKRYEVRTEDTAVDIQIHKAFSTKHKK